MKKLKFGVLVMISLFILSCEKEKENDPVNLPIDVYADFKTQTDIQFSGTILGIETSWVYDNGNDSIDASYGFDWGLTSDPTIKQCVFDIYTHEKRVENYSLIVKSPSFSINSTYNYKKSIFEVGEKKFNSASNAIFEGFEVILIAKNGYYTTSYGNQESSSFEIIKMEELPANPEKFQPRKLRLWIVLSCNLYEGGNIEKSGEIKNGKFIAEITLDSNL